jgi:Right handed beta helix region
MFKSDHNQIRKNSVRRNWNGGMVAIEGEGNVLSRNPGFRDGGGIQITTYGPGPVANVVRSNQVRGSSGRCWEAGGAPAYCSGISVGPAAERTLVSRNHVVGSGHDGINILSDSTTLTRNRTVGNGDLGIEAVEGLSTAAATGPAGTAIRASA